MFSLLRNFISIGLIISSVFTYGMEGGELERPVGTGPQVDPIVAAIYEAAAEEVPMPQFPVNTGPENYQDRANSVYRCLSDACQNMQGIIDLTDEQIQADSPAYENRLRINVDCLNGALRDLDIIDQHGRQMYAQDDLTAQDRNTARLMENTIQTLKKNIKETSDDLQQVLSNRQLRERWNSSWLARPRLLGQLFVKSLTSPTISVPDRVMIQDALQQERSFVEQVRQLGNILGNREYQIPEGQLEDDVAGINRKTINFFTLRPQSDRTSDVISGARTNLNIQTVARRFAKRIVPEETAATLRNTPYVGRVVNAVISDAVEEYTYTDAMINTGNPNAQLHALADNVRGSYNPLGSQDIDRAITYVLGNDLVGHKKNLMRLIKYSPLRPTNTLSLLSRILIPSLYKVEAILNRAAIDPSAPYVERVQQENNVSHDLSLFERFSRYFRQKSGLFARGILEDVGAAIPAIGSGRATYLFDTVADDAPVTPSSLWSRWLTKIKYKSSLCARYIMRKILGADAVNRLQEGYHGVPISRLVATSQRLFGRPIVRNFMNKHNGDLKAYARWYLRRDRQAAQQLHDAIVTHDGLSQLATQLGQGLQDREPIEEEAAWERLTPLFADI